MQLPWHSKFAKDTTLIHSNMIVLHHLLNPPNLVPNYDFCFALPLTLVIESSSACLTAGGASIAGQHSSVAHHPI
jgi:hypothetical protein